MNIICNDCEGTIDIQNDCIPDEIISCSDCGLDYVVLEESPGQLTFKELVIEGEDWGE